MKEECGDRVNEQHKGKLIATNPFMRPDSHTRLVTMRRASRDLARKSVVLLKK